MGVIKNTILGIVGLAVVGGATAMAIPQSRNWCLDQIAKHSTIYKTAINERDDAREDAKNKQETINSLNKTVAEKEQALKEANELIATKNALIAEKDATIAEKQKAIAEKDAEIAEKDAEIAEKQSLIEAKDKTIAEQTTSINTLTTQKTSLLSAVTEIDQKINSTSDSVEIDNLEAKKTTILTRIEELDSQIETLTTQKAKLENDVKTLQADKTQLQSEVETLTSDKTKLQNQVNSLTSEKTQLQQEVATLTTEKQNLQNQIDILNAQLAEFEQYTLNIDQTNPVESITIEDTKLGTSATMSNVNITTLKLYSWQNATIKYAAVENDTIKATLNGTAQETDTVKIVGSDNKGAIINIGSAIQPVEYEYSIAYSLGGHGIDENSSYPNDLYSTGDKIYYAQYFAPDSNGYNVQISVPLKTSTIYLFNLKNNVPELKYTISKKAKGTSDSEEVKTDYISIDLNSLTFDTQNCVGNNLGGSGSWSYTCSTAIFKTEVEYNGVKLPIERTIRIVKDAEVNQIVIPDNFAGLYKSGTDELTKSWSQLLADGDITVTDGAFKVTNRELEGDLVCDNVEELISFNSAFLNCSKLTSIDLSNFDTSNVTNMWAMFQGCSTLSTLVLSNFDTSNVTNMKSMFSYCSNLSSLDLSKFDTSNVTDMSYMFQNCSSLTNLDLSSFNFTKVTSYDFMFDSVSTSCEILVKDETAKTWINTNFPTLTNVKIKTAEASA